MIKISVVLFDYFLNIPVPTTQPVANFVLPMCSSCHACVL